jgi:hypothetical protein
MMVEEPRLIDEFGVSRAYGFDRGNEARSAGRAGDRSMPARRDLFDRAARYEPPLNPGRGG